MSGLVFPNIYENVKRNYITSLPMEVSNKGLFCAFLAKQIYLLTINFTAVVTSLSHCNAKGIFPVPHLMLQ